MDHEPLLQFHAGSDVQTDFGNWFVPTIAALRALCIAAGFSKVEVVEGPPAAPPPEEPSRAWRLRNRSAPPPPPPSAPTCAYRAVVHAYV